MADKYINSTGLGAIKTWFANLLSEKQDTLISGENIKTVNNQSLLGSDNISVVQGTFSNTHNNVDLQQGSNSLTVAQTTNGLHVTSTDGENEIINREIPSMSYVSQFQTSAQVDAKIIEELENFEHLDYEKVNTLPQAGEDGVRYLLYVADQSEEGYHYEEYMYINGQWIDIGKTTDVHLDDYYTKLETNDLLDAKQDVLTFDSSPTANSDNPVTSDGIKTVVDDLQYQIDGLGEPFRVKQWAGSNLNVEIPCCTEDISNTSIAKMVFKITGQEATDFQVVGMIAYEVKNASGQRLNCWNVCQFTGQNQTELSVRWMCGGTTRQIAASINAWVLLKHR